MLNIITDYRKVSENSYVLDVEKYFSVKCDFIAKHKEFRNIINKIDNAKIIADKVIETPFGITTTENLSSGTKALLIALNYPNKFVNFLEAGNNVVALALELAEKYDMNIVMSKIYSLQGVPDLTREITLNGIKNKTMRDYNEEVTK